MTSLQDLTFSDLFLSASPEDTWFKETPDGREAKLVPPHFHEAVKGLREKIEQECGFSESDIYQYASHVNLDGEDGRPGMRLRVKQVKLYTGDVLYVCRAFRVDFKSLRDLGVPERLVDKMLDPGLRGGLVGFIGRAGAGKTTTAYSFLREYVQKFGGAAFTLECPVEAELQGPCGKGWIYQTQVVDNSDLEQAIREKFQASPNLLFIGEIYGAGALREAIKAAAAGALVFFTFHGDDLESGIARLSRLGGLDSRETGLADVLKAAIYLELRTKIDFATSAGSLIHNRNSDGTGNPPRILGMQSLFLTGQDTWTDGVRQTIRNGEFHHLGSAIEHQRTQILNRRS